MDVNHEPCHIMLHGLKEDREMWLVSRRAKHDAVDSVGYAPPSLFQVTADNPTLGALLDICKAQGNVQSTLNSVKGVRCSFWIGNVQLPRAIGIHDVV
jgi:hypothetical protein